MDNLDDIADGLMVTISMQGRPASQVTVPEDDTFVLLTYDVDMDPNAPALNFSLTTNSHTFSDTKNGMAALGEILHVLSHSLMSKDTAVMALPTAQDQA